MSNQCPNLFNYRSFNLFPPFHTFLKPYSTTLRPVFPFHGNLILIDRRPGSRKSSLPPPIAAQSSSDVVLLATTEHHDGSLIFKFGDASEVVKIDEVVEEIESKVELESNVVKGLDGDQEIEDKIEGEYGSDTSRLTEVPDEITNTDSDSDIAEIKANVTSDLIDHHAESIEILSHISEEEVLTSQFDAKVIESLEDVVRTLDKTEDTAQLDEEECLNPIVDDETDEQSVFVNPESLQASDIEVMDVKLAYVEDKVETEDVCKSSIEELMPPATIVNTDDELMDSENEDVNEEMEDIDISSTEDMDVKNQAMEIELQEVSFNKRDEHDVAYLIHVEDADSILEDDVSQVQSTPVLLNPSMQVSDIEIDDTNTISQNPDDVILETNNKTEDTLVSVMLETDELQKVEPEDSTSYSELVDAANEDMEEGPEIQVADVKVEATMEASTTKDMDQSMEDELQQEQTEPILEEEVSQAESTTPLEFKPTMKVSDIELEDTMGLNSSDETLLVIDETEDQLESVKLETVQVSDNEVTDELLEVDTRESDGKDSSDIQLTEAENGDMVQGLQDMNITLTLIDGLPPLDTLRDEPTSDDESQLQPANGNLEVNMEVLITESIDVEDELQQVSTGNSDENDDVENKSFTIQVSVIEAEEDSKVESIEDVLLQIKDVERSLHQLEAQLVQDEGVNVNHNISEQCDETDVLGSSNLLENGLQVEAERIEDKVSSSEVAVASEKTATLLDTKTELEREEIYFLSSGAALLDHPFKELTGGDDAYFVSSSKWLGVANGVSQWSLEGSGPGVYAQELMRTCKDIVINTTLTNNPVELLCRGVKETNMSGSSNILIANFNGQALHVANIGDTGFIIIKHGAVYKKSCPLLHDFPFALQVEDQDDPLQLVEEYVIELEEGDIVVSATDGLFDNLYEKEIAMVVSNSLQAGMKPDEVAKVLGTRAQEVGRSALVRSPFSDAAQAAGYTAFTGGKPDKVAVIVSLVQKTC